MRLPAGSDAYRVLWPVRKGQMWAEEFVPQRRGPSQPRLFNLDLHIGVIRDLAVELQAQGAHLRRWSISGHNSLLRHAFRFPDPVGVVNSRTWVDLDENMIDRFQDRYGRFLRQFDGFVATYPPAFAQLFANTGKPVLVALATRYEVPFSDRPGEWRALDEFLRSGMQDERLSIIANNQGDADYFEHFVGMGIDVVPSVCDYQAPSPRRGNGTSVVLGRRGPALEAVLAAGGGSWQTTTEAYGTPYAWKDLAGSREVLVIPYNVSTMTLFELATAGTPVAVPGPELLKELAAIDGQVLSELSFFQVRGLSAVGLSGDDPNNLASGTFVEWWLERADFYNAELMPNVRIVDEIEDLREPSDDRRRDPGYWLGVLERNEELVGRRATLVGDFLSTL